MLIKLDHFLQFFGFIKFKKKPFVQPQFLDVNHFPFLPFIEGETWNVSCPFFRGAKTWTAEFQAIHFDKIVLHVMAEMIKKFRKMIPSAKTNPNSFIQTPGKIISNQLLFTTSSVSNGRVCTVCTMLGCSLWRKAWDKAISGLKRFSGSICNKPSKGFFAADFNSVSGKVDSDAEFF